MIISIRELALLIGTLTNEPALTIEPIDLACLTRNVYHEARDQGPEGMIAVAYVTTQRLRSGRWGNTFCQVVEAPKQFSWHSDGKPDAPADLTAYKDALTAAVLVLTGRAEDTSNGASHYFAPRLASPVWAASMTISATVGDHVFLTDCQSTSPAPICAPAPTLKPRRTTMAKYELTATVELTIDGLTIYLDVEPKSQQDFFNAAEEALDKRLVVLDIKGSRSGDDGMITDIVIPNITNWNRID